MIVWLLFVQIFFLSKYRKYVRGLFFSVEIIVFDFLHSVFFQVQYIPYCWKYSVEKLRRNFKIFFLIEVINWIEDKEVGIRPIFQCWYYGFLFSAFCVFPSTLHTLLLETLRRKITKKFLQSFLWKSLTEKRIRRLALSVFR